MSDTSQTVYAVRRIREHTGAGLKEALEAYRQAGSAAGAVNLLRPPTNLDADRRIADMKAACRAAVEKQLIHGALSLQGKTDVEQADAVLAAIDAVEVR